VAKTKQSKRMAAKAPLDQLFESAPAEAKTLIQVFKAEKRAQDRAEFMKRTQLGGGQ
jgi:hypothetical protein